MKRPNMEGVINDHNDASAGKPQVLKYGIDFKVFNHLAEPISAEEVAKSGRHAELLIADGMYSRMWDNQQQARGWKFGAHQRSG